MLKSTARLLLGVMALMLAGCISVGTIDRRASTLNGEVGNTMNQSLLLNLARASRDEPIYFIAINQLSAGGTTDFRLGLPQFYLGPKLPAADLIGTFDANGSTFVDNQTNSSFQLSLLGSKDFYNGLMAPLDLQDVDLMLHQGYSRELIFYLVIDKATVTPIGADGKPGAPQVIYNDPTDTKTFPLFEYYIKQAMEHGLTTDTFQAPDEDDGDDSAPPDPKLGDKPKKPKLKMYAELCYDRALAIPGDLADIAPDTFCGAKPAVRASAEGGDSLPVKLNNQNLQVDVATRSIYGVFYYLGGIMAHEQQARVHMRHYDLPAEVTNDDPLLQVLVNGKTDKASCFAAVGYEGSSYCVPQQGATNTKRIFGILNALLALKQSIADQPVTQTVRIQQ